MTLHQYETHPGGFTVQGIGLSDPLPNKSKPAPPQPSIRLPGNGFSLWHGEEWIFFFCTGHDHFPGFVRFHGGFHSTREKMHARYGWAWSHQSNKTEGEATANMHHEQERHVDCGLLQDPFHPANLKVVEEAVTGG